MKRFAILIPALLVTAGAAAQAQTYQEARHHCQSVEDRRQIAGGVVGALGGAVLGNNLAGNGAKSEGAVIGALAGAALGAGIADKSIDCDPAPHRQLYVGTRGYTAPVHQYQHHNRRYAAPRHAHHGYVQSRPAPRYVNGHGHPQRYAGYRYAAPHRYGHHTYAAAQQRHYGPHARTYHAQPRGHYRSAPAYSVRHANRYCPPGYHCR